MSAPPVSVVVVSRARPGELRRCLLGLVQLDYPAFEIVLVADPVGLRAADTAGYGGRIRMVAFDEANISAARNLGIAAAAGEIVAFIDDDAVPEPGWLTHLATAFRDDSVDAAGGYVRGRNGITFQYRGAWLDAEGLETPLSHQGLDPFIARTAPGRALKTEGTNCAFRAGLLRDIGGFDPALRYFNDETDLNLRLARAQARVAIVPRAEVHHGIAGSDRRTRQRAPRTLFDVGASSVVLLRKHSPDTDRPGFLAGLIAEQRRRLLRHMVAGACAPGDINPILDTLVAGWEDGEARALGPLPPLVSSAMPFLRVPPLPVSGTEIMAGRSLLARRHRVRAAARVAEGRRVSLFLFSPTMLNHEMRFTRRGVWEQRGGLFGRSDRDQPLFQWQTFGKRLRQELARISEIREMAWES